MIALAQHTQQIVAEVREALDAAELDKVHVTTDPHEAASATRHGVVIVSPGKITFPNYDEIDVEPQLTALAGPADNVEAAWAKLAAILAALHAARVPLVSAEPDTFSIGNGPAVPGYALTLSTDSVTL